MQRVTPFVWLDDAEAAVDFYVATFRDARIERVARFPEGAPAPAGTVMSVAFTIGGLRFVALNGRPAAFALTPATSFLVACKDQQEIDHLWERLSADGGNAMSCGWVTDKFGVTWQIVPDSIEDLFAGDGDDRESATRALHALWTMEKIDIAQLEAARAAR